MEAEYRAVEQQFAHSSAARQSSYQQMTLDEKIAIVHGAPLKPTKAYVGYFLPIRDSASRQLHWRTDGGRWKSRTRRDFAASPIAVASSWILA